MEKYVIKDGLVCSLKDDFDYIQEVIFSNMRSVMKTFVIRPGLKLKHPSEAESFTLTIEDLGATWRYKISNLAPVIFQDYDIWTTDATYISKVDTAPLQEKYVVLHKTTTLDIANSISTTSAELLITDNMDWAATDDINYIPLYCVKPDKTIEIDFRHDYTLKLRPDCDNVAPYPISNVEVKSMYTNSILSRQTRYNSDSNFSSPGSNMMMKELWLDVSWDNMDNTEIYQVSLTPHSESGIELPAARILKNVHYTFNSTLIRAIEGVKYSVRVRAIDNSNRRNIGAWSDPVVLVAGSDLLVAAPTSPSLSISASSNPTILMINTKINPQPPQPYFVQIEKMSPWGKKEWKYLKDLYMHYPFV